MSDIEDLQTGIDATGNDVASVETHVSTESTVADKPKDLGEIVEQALSKVERKHNLTSQEQEAPKVVQKDQRIVENGKQFDPITGQELQPIKAPVSWTPVLREKWTGIDPQVQKFINDRERELQTTLSKTADERKFASEIRNALEPMEPLFKQYGVNGVDHVRELLHHSRTLNTGTPQEKAALIHSMILQFKPDVQTLVALNSGQMHLQAPQQRIDPQAEVERLLSEREYQKATEEVSSEIDTFANDPAHEFFYDVKESMGRIIEAGLVDGNNMTELFKNAYELACSRHPEIQQIMAGRQSTQVQAVPQASTKPKPVVGAKPSLSSGSTQKKRSFGSVDAAINAAADEVFRNHGL